MAHSSRYLKREVDVPNEDGRERSVFSERMIVAAGRLHQRKLKQRRCFVKLGPRDKQSSHERKVFAQLLLEKQLSTVGPEGAAGPLEKNPFCVPSQGIVATTPSNSVEGHVDLRLLLCQARH